MAKKKRRLKIAHFGAFNHDSFGDLIFPYIAENYLKDFELVHVAPSSNPTIWTDAKSVITIKKAFSINNWDGVLVGGGDIIQGVENFIWHDSHVAAMGAISSLWCGASIFSSKLGIPCAWNSPGVPHILSDKDKLLSSEALKATNYISVRDSLSQNNLKHFNDSKINISPDSALLISDIWKKRKADEQYIAMSLTTEDLKYRKHEIFDLFSRFQSSKKFPSKIIILPLMNWQSDALGDELEYLKSKFNITVLNKQLSLHECAMVISGANFYIGNSLHGLITAVSYQLPAAVIKPKGLENAFKYEGFASHFPGAKFIGKDYREVYDIISQKQTFNLRPKKEEVIENFNNISKCFSKKPVSGKK